MADIWSASAEALRLYYVWLRDYGMNEGKTAEECGVILADIGWVGAHQVLHCAPFLVKDISAENPKVYDNDGTRILDMYRIGPKMPAKF